MNKTGERFFWGKGFQKMTSPLRKGTQKRGSQSPKKICVPGEGGRNLGTPLENSQSSCKNG